MDVNIETNIESDNEIDNEMDIEMDIEMESDDDGMDIESSITNINFDQQMEVLESILNENKKKITAYDYLRYRSIYEFFTNWRVNNMTREDAAFDAAKKVYDKGVYCTRKIRRWAKY